MKRHKFFPNAIFRTGIVCISVCLGTLGLSSCGEGYDDTEVRNGIKGLEDRVTTLEEWQKSVNSDIHSLQSLVSALEDKNFITGVTPIMEGNEEVGYKITFQKGDPIIIKHGKNGINGSNGNDGSTPVIGVAKGDDGISYYWTVKTGNAPAEFLKDEQGNNIPVTGAKGDKGEQGAKGDKGEQGAQGDKGEQGAQGDKGEQGAQGDKGADATAPQLRINTENNEWEISVDGGAKWTSMGVVAKGEKGDSMFGDVDVDSDPDSVTFTLSDGTTTITVPRINTLTIGFKSYGLFEVAPKNKKIDIILPTTLKEADYNALVVELKTAQGVDLAVATRSTASAVSIHKPTFNDGVYNNDAAVTINKTYDGTAILKVTLIDKKGQEISASRPVNLLMKVSNAEEFIAAVQESGAVAFSGDITVNDNMNFSSDQNVTVNLNNHTLNLGGGKTCEINGKSSVTYKNGKIIVNRDDSNYFDICVKSGSLVFDNVEFSSPKGGGLSAQGKTSYLTIRNSKVTGCYFGFSTNASLDKVTNELTGGKDATILLENSEIVAIETAFMNNIPANVTIKGCTLKGNHQAALLRGGTYVIEDSTFILNAELAADHFENKHDSDWADGNRAAFAAITIGNRGTGAYQYPTKVTMKNVTAKVEGVNASYFPAVYVYANSGAGLGVGLTYDDSTFTSTYQKPIEFGTDNNVIVNGKKPIIN